MTSASYHNRLRDALASGRFLVTVEYASPVATQPLEEVLGPILALARGVRDDPRIDAIALTDRSRSDHDHDPIVLGGHVAEASGKMPLVHWAGKGRSLSDLESDLDRAQRLGLSAFLLVTGDPLRRPPQDRPTDHLDSVTALRAARARGDAVLLAAPVSPFRHGEDGFISEYLKAGEKIRAGADYLIAQIGWDMERLRETHRSLSEGGHEIPLVAALLFLTPRRYRHIREFGLPGVVVPDELAHRLEEEATLPDGGRAAAFRRLALQVAGVRGTGMAGVHICGLHRYDSVARLLDEVEAAASECATQTDWRHAWQEALTLKDGRIARTAPAGDEGTPGRPATSGSAGAE
jgi:methylenetetrahydrofolate reductase (NADPH)